MSTNGCGSVYATGASGNLGYAATWTDTTPYANVGPPCRVLKGEVKQEEAAALYLPLNSSHPC